MFIWNDEPENDYIRVRRYPAANSNEFKRTEVDPAFNRTGLFKTGIAYKMTWIKAGSQLLLQVEGDEEVKGYSWDLSSFEPITEGRIALRHMFTRSSAYKNFKVWELIIACFTLKIEEQKQAINYINKLFFKQCLTNH